MQTPLPFLHDVPIKAGDDVENVPHLLVALGAGRTSREQRYDPHGDCVLAAGALLMAAELIRLARGQLKGHDALRPHEEEDLSYWADECEELAHFAVRAGGNMKNCCCDHDRERAIELAREGVS